MVQALLRLHLTHPVIHLSGRRAKETWVLVLVDTCHQAAQSVPAAGMLRTSLADAVLSLATSLIPDKLMRKASQVIIKMMGLSPPDAFLEQKQDIKKPKTRRCLQIHGIKVRCPENVPNSYQTFLMHHELKYQSMKLKLTRSKNIMLTIYESESDASES